MYVLNSKNNTFKPAIRFISSLILILIAIIILANYYFDLFNWSINNMAIIIFIVVLFSYCRLFSIKSYYKLGFHMVILTYTFLTHFGSIIAFALEGENSFIRSQYSMRFLYMDELEKAVMISLFTCIMFVLFVPTLRRVKENDTVSKNKENVSERHELPIFLIGMIIQVVGFTLLLSLIFKGYLNIPYTTRNGVMNSIWWYGHINILLSYAFCMMIATLPFKKWKYGLILFILIAVVHFILGNRGEVLYSSLTSIAVYYLKNKGISKKVVFTGIVSLIFIIPLVRNFREASTLEFFTTGLYSNVIELFSELGFQIASFTYIVQAVDEGIGLRFGGTYLYAFADFIMRKLPFLSQVPEISLNNIKYLMPQNGLGFTHIGEAFYNFGILGSGLYYVAFSRFLIWMEDYYTSSFTSTYKKIFSVLIIVEFVNLTRNSFVTFPVYISYIFILIITVHLLSKIRK